MKKNAIISFFISLGLGLILDFVIKENMLHYPPARAYYILIQSWSHLDFLITIFCIILWCIYWIPRFFKKTNNPDNYELKFDSNESISYD